MSTSIEWTHVPGYRGDVWNPTTGCNKVSQGCKHCYAETMHRRLHAMGVKGYERPFLDGARPVRERLHKPLKAKKPTAYFVNSMSDLFHADVPFSYIDQVFAVMALCPQHLFIVLTKRPERMAEYTTTHFGRLADRIIAMRREQGDNGVVIPLPNVSPGEPWWPLSNVWLGTSVEDQATADARIPHLLKCPAAVRFLSCEPLLGAVDLTSVDGVPYGGPQGHRIDCIRKGYWDEFWGFVNHSDLHDTFGPLHWVIAGGESGPKARPMHPDWARGLRDQCQAAGVPFFFKQWGQWVPVNRPWVDDQDPVACAHNERWMNNKGGFGFHGEQVWRMRKLGKQAAGRLLDGVEHNGWPAVVVKQGVKA